MGYNDYHKRIKKLAGIIKRNKSVKDIFGIPRGGLIPAAHLSYLTNLPLTGNPKTDSTAIIDDCLDSGATAHSFSNFKHFYVLIDKQEEDIKGWIIFFWDKEFVKK